MPDRCNEPPLIVTRAHPAAGRWPSKESKADETLIRPANQPIPPKQPADRDEPVDLAPGSPLDPADPISKPPVPDPSAPGDLAGANPPTSSSNPDPNSGSDVVDAFELLPPAAELAPAALPAPAPAQVPPPGPAAPPASPAAAPIRRVEVPAEHYNRISLWLQLLAVVLACLPPLLIDLTASESAHVLANPDLLTSREVWQQKWTQGERSWFVPLREGAAADQIQPPMSVWMNLLAWADLPADASENELYLRSRLVNVIFSALALAGIFWAGMGLGGLRVALLGTLVAGTCILFHHQSRAHAAGIELLAWVNLGVGAGLWAIRPLKEMNWAGRRVFGWVIAGLAAGMAILTAGPLGLVMIGAPLILASLMGQYRRIGNFFGLLFAGSLGFIVAAPWYLKALEKVPEAKSILLPGFPRMEHWMDPAWPLWWVGGLILPWGLWAAASLLEPFLPGPGSRRRQMLITWVWLLAAALIFVMPQEWQGLYMLSLMAPGALLIGQLLDYHSHIALEGRATTGYDIVGFPHWVLTIVLSIALPAGMIWGGWGLDLGPLGRWELPIAGWPAALGLSVGLLVICLFGVKWHLGPHPLAASLAFGVWIVLLSTFIAAHGVRDDETLLDARTAALEIRRITDKGSLHFLQHSAMTDEPNAAFLYYLGRPISRAAPMQIEHEVQRAGKAGQRVYILVKTGGRTQPGAFLEKLSFRMIKAFQDADGAECLLYAWGASPAAQAEAEEK